MPSNLAHLMEKESIDLELLVDSANALDFRTALGLTAGQYAHLRRFAVEEQQKIVDAANDN